MVKLPALYFMATVSRKFTLFKDTFVNFVDGTECFI